MVREYNYDNRNTYAASFALAGSLAGAAALGCGFGGLAVMNFFDNKEAAGDLAIASAVSAGVAVCAFGAACTARVLADRRASFAEALEAQQAQQAQQEHVAVEMQRPGAARAA